MYVEEIGLEKKVLISMCIKKRRECVKKIADYYVYRKEGSMYVGDK